MGIKLPCLALMAWLVCDCLALDNGLALTPPMGWLAWERFRCVLDCDTYPDECISEALVRRTADKMVSDGYAALGYEYVIIDDCWLSSSRDDEGRLQPDPKRFPTGIKALADYVHSKGLKLGIYEDYGNFTCGGYPGVLGHLETDANTFANWEVDYIKLDGCYVETKDMDTGYPEFGRYLNATGRPIVYSCSWPAYQEDEGTKPDYDTMKETCNLWRNYGDIDDSWDSVVDIIDWFGDNQDRIASKAGPGHWNDPDMLIIGNFGLSYDQSKAQFALWAILAAPLLMSVDLNTIEPEFKAILQNPSIIAVNQDPLGIQGKRKFKINSIEVWTRPLTAAEESEKWAVAVLSQRTDGIPYQITINFKDIGLNNSAGYILEDLYSHQVLGRVQSDASVTVRVNPSGVLFYTATASNPDEPSEVINYIW